MKTINLLAIIILCNLTIHAQTEKGTFSVGLHNFSPSGLNIDGIPLNLFGRGTTFGVAFGTTKNKLDGFTQGETEKLYTLGLNVSGHYFPVNNLSLGFVGQFFSGFTVYKDEGSETERYSAWIMMGGPEARFYMGKGKTRFWLKGSTSLGTLNSKQNLKKDPDRIKLFQVAGGFGITHFISPKISVDAGIDYNVFQLKFEENFKGINTNLAADLGFTLFF